MDGFSMDLPAGARFVLERLAGAGFAAYVVGGCVRDAMRGAGRAALGASPAAGLGRPLQTAGGGAARCGAVRGGFAQYLIGILRPA